jgi:hypothetical protein
MITPVQLIEYLFAMGLGIAFRLQIVLMIVREHMKHWNKLEIEGDSLRRQKEDEREAERQKRGLSRY